MAAADVERLIRQLAKLPGLGPRSARRVALHMIQQKETVMRPLAEALAETAESVGVCSQCGNIDTTDPCEICTDPRRDVTSICVVEQVGDLWALERASAFRGRYHVLGGVLSALDGITPEDLNIENLIPRAASGAVSEIILATNATVDGQTTAHYLTERLEGCNVAITRLARGVPVGGELDYLDDGTLITALASRKEL
ncbi:recombination mediator RecR [Minwuia sp.]|uniref:recombination mediator RecR n=1 Tax=Minwuia sp. TaxID=2493630 RepID=UPI003A91A611